MPAPIIQARVTLTNYFSPPYILSLAGSGQAGWPATNAFYPQQPFVPWKTLDTTQNIIWVDFGVARPIDMVIAVNVNYTTARIVLDSDPAFEPGEYDTGPLTIHRNPWHGRYTLAHPFAPPPPFPYRYLAFVIPAQSTTDGLSYFRTGGIWAGPFTALPRDIRWDERLRRVEPHLDVSLIGGGTHRVRTGQPVIEMRGQRIATTLRTSPGTGDELGSWLTLDQLFYDWAISAWYFNRGNNAEAFIFRKMNESDWNVHQVVSEDEIVLHEVVGP